MYVHEGSVPGRCVAPADQLEGVSRPILGEETEDTKTHWMVVVLAVLFLVTACGGSPWRASATTPTVSLSQIDTNTLYSELTQGPDSTRQVSTNVEVGFSIQYPSSWQIATLPDENAGQRHRILLKGPEGGLELDWGVGLGGACPEGYQPLRVAQGELHACHGQNADGTEQWNLAEKQLGQIGFSAVASTNNTAANGRDVVLQILSTLSFP